MLVARFVAASVGVETVPTEVIGSPSVFTVVLVEGDQFAMRLTPKCRCIGNPARSDVEPGSPGAIAG